KTPDSAVITLGFASVYWLLADIPGNGIVPIETGDPITRALNAVYYSIIIGTTTGLGDIAPHGVSRLFTAIQAILSFILLAMFVAKFAARKQEKVLNDIHQISFDSSFHSIRNGLYVARKDIDTVIVLVLEHGAVSEKGWMNLRAALRQIQIFSKHIPDFYRKTAKTHAFDIDREMLLIDSLGRTLFRLVEALDLFRRRDKAFLEEKRVEREFMSLIRTVENMSLHEEQKTLDPENHEAFQEILNSTAELRAYFVASK
ncbi:MAG: potassium channel family protein, partial [Patescibacteria group bacterium]